MKRIGFALATGLAAVLFAASPASADTPTVPAAPPVVTPTVVGGSFIPGDTVSPAPARRGLFGRVRNRGTTYSTPAALPATVTSPAPAATPAPAIAPVPATMPVKPISGTTTGTTVTPAGVMTMTTGTPAVMTANYSTPVQQAPRGLFGRVRARRG